MVHFDYSRDLWLYMCHREETTRPQPNFMAKQKELSENMRAVLVDWLVDVAVDFDFHLETLHLAISIVDRVLSVNDVPRAKLQLVGTTAMLVAS